MCDVDNSDLASQCKTIRKTGWGKIMMVPSRKKNSCILLNWLAQFLSCQLLKTHHRDKLGQSICGTILANRREKIGKEIPPHCIV